MLQAVLMVASVAIAALPSGCRSGTVTVEKSPRDPRNPLVWVETNRPELSYAGPLHQFEAIHGMHGISLKMEMTTGQHQCYYFILTEGYQITIFAASMSQDVNRFHLLVANSDERFLKKFSDTESIQFTHNVTEADTYEVCLINSIGIRQIMFSAVYYQRQRYDEELKNLIAKSELLSNITSGTEVSIRNIETNIGKVLISLRYQPHLYRDYVAIQASNAWVQRKSIGFIVLMLCSFGGTTLFIHYLFHVPKGKVAI